MKMANLISSEDKVKLFMNDCKNYEEQIDKLTKQKKYYNLRVEEQVQR